MVVSDRRGRIVHANEAFAKRLEMTREQLLDKPLAECHRTRSSAAWLQGPRRFARPTLMGQTPAYCEMFDPVLNGPFMITVTDL